MYVALPTNGCVVVPAAVDVAGVVVAVVAVAAGVVAAVVEALAAKESVSAGSVGRGLGEGCSFSVFATSAPPAAGLVAAHVATPAIPARNVPPPRRSSRRPNNADRCRALLIDRYRCGPASIAPVVGTQPNRAGLAAR
jgi:hypothetical protein